MFCPSLWYWMTVVLRDNFLQRLLVTPTNTHRFIALHNTVVCGLTYSRSLPCTPTFSPHIKECGAPSCIVRSMPNWATSVENLTPSMLHGGFRGEKKTNNCFDDFWFSRFNYVLSSGQHLILCLKISFIKIWYFYFQLNFR